MIELDCAKIGARAEFADKMAHRDGSNIRSLRGAIVFGEVVNISAATIVLELFVSTFVDASLELIVRKVFRGEGVAVDRYPFSLDVEAGCFKPGLALSAEVRFGGKGEDLRPGDFRNVASVPIKDPEGNISIPVKRIGEGQ